jgi:hypothetical protein
MPLPSQSADVNLDHHVLRYMAHISIVRRPSASQGSGYQRGAPVVKPELCERLLPQIRAAFAARVAADRLHSWPHLP